ncbi:homeobox-leucine zipper protein HAT9-like [Zingiber officinale]|uniref:homeobox-leucine zipper protein HAT9-like n=1 Tax=Zingiber officinale TaxID=94328 RepID=UPI001C4BB3A5|nr:homeobox-leucine zipper protein HAT9-like [Zingiber officinale]
MDDEPTYSETTLSLKLSYRDPDPPRRPIFEGCSSAARPDDPALSLGDRGGARKKLRLSKEQAALLEDMFKEHSTLNLKQKQALAGQLKLLPRQVEVWFQNRRARTKLKKTQVEREILRKCCDALREENKRLRKELHELKSTKCPATRFTRPPQAALVICSSCKKVINDEGGNSDGTEGSGSVSAEVAKPRFFNLFAHSTS